MNSDENIERFNLFRVGWRRRSAIMLNVVGCPRWLIERRCPQKPGWGTVLDELVNLAYLWQED